MRRLRQVVSWFVVVEGILLGMLVIAVAGGFGGPTPVGIVIGMLAGLAAIVASLVAICDRRMAARIALWVSPITPLCILGFSWEFGSIGWSAAIFSAAVLIPGFFWRITERREWPPLIASPLLSRQRWQVAIAGIGLSGLLAVGASVWFLSLPWWPPVGDCFGRSFLDEHGVPRGIDFTAKIVFVGPRTCRGRSLWSIAHVEERLAGSRSKAPDLIVLRGFFQRRDQSRRFFVEGQASGGALLRFLPVIEPMPCGRMAFRE